MEKKISVIIPNYNGKELLEQNLPNVIKYCPNCEIIIVDDGSTDGSAQLIKNKFKNIKLIETKKNLGFSKAINLGVEKAQGRYILLLNSDTSPQKDFLEPLKKHFQKDKLFAVALADYSHEDGEIVIRGRGGANFKKGFLAHFAASIKSGETLWVSGGSGIFDKEKFLNLDGFDPIFHPFYWEDIDLSYRAAKSGYICQFEPKSKVDHFHQKGAIKTKFAWQFVEIVSYKNQFLFVWKNISDPLLLSQHILWLPYHFTKAFLRLDAYFFLGFFWALFQIPKLIFNFPQLSTNYQLSDREIIKKFEKP